MSIIQNINPYFPILEKGDKIDFNDPVLGEHKNCEVLGTWYPKYGDRWSESEECKHLGYLHSKPKEWFPQIVIDVKGKIATMWGTDAKYITRINNKKFIYNGTDN